MFDSIGIKSDLYLIRSCANIILEQGEFITIVMFLFSVYIKDGPIFVLLFSLPILCLDMDLEIKAAVASCCAPDAKPVFQDQQLQ